MKTIYRIGMTTDAITIEHWPSWAAFDVAPPSRATSRADIAYAATTVGAMATAPGVHELQHIRVVNGRMADVTAHLADDLEAWSGAGAQGIGAFTVVHGDNIPACLVLLRWPSMKAALEGQIAFRGERSRPRCAPREPCYARPVGYPRDRTRFPPAIDGDSNGMSAMTTINPSTHNRRTPDESA